MNLKATDEELSEKWNNVLENWDYPISPELVLESIVNNTDVAFSIKDKEGNFVFANKALVKSLDKKDKSEVIGKNNFKLFNSETAEIFNNDDHVVLEIGKSLSTSERLQTENNNLKWQLSNKFPVKINEDIKAMVTVSQDITERKRMEDELRYYSETDGLTGIFNRRVFDMMIVREWDRARRNNYPLSLILMDIDYFKKFNDIYGHQSGDEAIKSFSNILKQQTKRPGDMACRYGGEEFVMLLPATDLRGSTTVGKRIIDGLADLAIAHEGSDVSNVLTVSWGVASIKPSRDGQVDELIRHADIALYEAKKKGRNCYSTWEPVVE